MPINFDREAARKAGYTDAEIDAYIRQRELQTGSRGKSESEKPQRSLLASLLPVLGGIGGATVGAVGGPVGVAAGGATGSGLGELLAQKTSREQTNLGRIAGETAFGAVGGALGKLLGLGGRLIGRTVGQGLTRAGESLAVKALRPSPSQQLKFARETGEQLSKFLQKRGLAGAGFDDIVKKIEPLQKKFDEVVTSAKIKVQPKDVRSRFEKQIARLNSSILPSDKQKAQVLQNIMGNFSAKFGGKTLTAKALTVLRRDVDEGIKNFNLDEAVKGPLNITRDVLQDTLRDIAEKTGVKVGEVSLKEAGIELSKLYKLLGIAERQQFLGRGSMPVGLTTLLGGAVGGGLGGGVGGAVLGIGAERTLNAPRVISLLSRGATRTGEAQASPILARLLGIGAQTTGQLGARTPRLFGQLGPQNGQSDDETANQGLQGLPPSSSVTPSNGQAQLITPEMVVMARLLFEPSRANRIEAAYKAQFLGQEQTKLSAQQEKDRLNAESGLRNLEKIRARLRSDPTTLIKAQLPGAIGARDYVRWAREVSDVYTRLRTGAALNEQEIEFYDSQLPGLLDFGNPAAIEASLRIFEDLFDSFATGQRSGATPQINMGDLNF